MLQTEMTNEQWLDKIIKREFNTDWPEQDILRLAKIRDEKQELEAENERQAKRIRQLIDGHFKSFNVRNKSIKDAYLDGFDDARKMRWVDRIYAWKGSKMAKMLRNENIHKREGRG